jgi:glutamate formiminotransferase/formiminotetrahydrofolate cyclodeaminase
MLVEDASGFDEFTNFRQTPVARVVEMIRSEASRYGVAIHHSELVGLIPQAALVDAAVWHLQLDQFTPDQILEARLYNALQKAHEPPEVVTTPAVSQDFLEALAAGTPTPGGGSAAAYAGAAAAALIAMVAHLTIGKKRYIEVEDEMRQVLTEAEPCGND